MGQPDLIEGIKTSVCLVMISADIGPDASDRRTTKIQNYSASVKTGVLNTGRELFTPRVRPRRTARRKNFDERGGRLGLRPGRPGTALHFTRADANAVSILCILHGVRVRLEGGQQSPRLAHRRFSHNNELASANASSTTSGVGALRYGSIAAKESHPPTCMTTRGFRFSSTRRRCANRRRRS